MRAVQVTRFGGPEVLRLTQLDRPEPISTEVLVRVIAAGVNPVDCKTRRGDGVARWVGPPPFVPGWDVCGVVESMGYGVTRFKVGDTVYGMPRFPRQAGAYAEYVSAPSHQFAAIPTNITPIEAAALPLAALTAWQSLVGLARIAAGQTVLVHGASGGVGHLAVQIAMAQGASVIAARRHDGEGLSPRNVDVALDLAGSQTEALVETLREGGLLLAVADGASDSVIAACARRGIRVEQPLVEPDGRDLEEISKLVESGKLKVNVEDVMPLAQAASAHERIEQGGRKGKLVLEVFDD
jgi:NADPH:quinone reductase-like Zn-dependent oxidoreductase